MRNHYVTLDGLRGVAALAVAILHTNINMGSAPWLPHAYLAVDFFFVLSGFVVAFAYDQKLLTDMTFFGFMRVRLIRLSPMIVAGTILGAFYLLMRTHLEPGAIGYIAVAVLFGVLLLPLDLVVGTEQYPLNVPSWSLLFELISNVCYAALA